MTILTLVLVLLTILSIKAFTIFSHFNSRIILKHHHGCYHRHSNNRERVSKVPRSILLLNAYRDNLGSTNITLNFEENVNDSNEDTKLYEQKIDYVGAGTLGDIMSDPQDDDDDEETLETTSQKSSTSANFSLQKPRNSGMSGTPVKMKSPHTNGLESGTIVSFPNSGNNPTKSGLVTKTGGTLQAQYGDKIPNLSPLDRIALTANGNLQRIFSSYYDAPVHVYVDQCTRREEEEVLQGCAIWDRIVHLSVFNQDFCKASSIITVHSDECINLVESGDVGIGQLFRYLDKLPTFALLNAGRRGDGGLWREYELKCEELTCNIREDFSPNAWAIAEIRLEDLDNTF